VTSPQKNYRTLAEWLADAVKRRDPDKCLMWPWGCDKDGYGKLTIRVDGEMMHVRAHRLSFYLVRKRWPEPYGLHNCDTPGCFNPAHIYEGDARKNNEDMANRNRSCYGEKNNTTVLTEKIVVQSRKEYAAGATFAVLAARYGVTKQTMRYAVIGKNWRRVKGAVKPRPSAAVSWTHCKRGHPLTPSNCYNSKSGGRCCRTCAIARASLYYQLHRTGKQEQR